jgi:DNA-binding response OmpR family regulator
VFNLRRKIEEKPDAPQYLITVHGVGYRLVLESTT